MSSTGRAGGVDPQSPTPGFLSDHRCTYLESAYHSVTLKSVAFQRKLTRPRWRRWFFLPQAQGQGLASCRHRTTLVPWGKPHLPWCSLSLQRRDRGRLGCRSNKRGLSAGTELPALSSFPGHAGPHCRPQVVSSQGRCLVSCG